MVQGESPIVARRRLRLALRQAREQKEFTQGQVAAALDWSLSKVQRIESGDVSVSRTDLNALLSHLGVISGERIDELADLARAARRRVSHWWEEPQYKDSLTPAVIKLLELENEATTIQVFQSTLIPGMLQTSAYARVIIDFWHEDLSEDDRNARYENRLLRRQKILDRLDPPKYSLLFDESVLHRIMGGPAVMVDQLDFLLQLVGQGKVSLRVLPFAVAGTLAMINPFTLLGFSDGDRILYREAQLDDEIVEVHQLVDLAKQRFERMWELALNGEDTVSLVHERVSAIRGGSR